MRYKQMESFKELLKKLVFTFEQDIKNSQKIDEQSIAKEEEIKNQSTLPSIPNNNQLQLQTPLTPAESKQQLQTVQSQNIEAKQQINKVTLKRLNYIQHTLDGYDPVKKKILFRSKVEEKKNQRIWELWRQELNDKNSIKDIAIKIDHQHKSGGRSMHHYDQMLN